MADPALGPRLRALRAAAEQTVATVATEAGLSVPYVANLENGRGNPTVETLSRLAGALRTRLVIEFVPESADSTASTPSRSLAPGSLVRWSRGARFRRDLHALADATGRTPADLAPTLLTALAGIADLAGHEPGEADWNRLLDALLLVFLHPHPDKQATR
ncbi:helix-turn-helix domain-containing protein [Saccharothrix sp. NRRL B-16314]|uniref:helix-turn-helix domain-containing protein n=1 Tax=Saccharothrix sp. NRRL B-16314 TaxID=1463825 RepID=UPI0012DEEA50|nr:helix-turn-helix transcriptional regulator [Saccharothrix sp. NRRL B-16314]